MPYAILCTRQQCVFIAYLVDALLCVCVQCGKPVFDLVGIMHCIYGHIVGNCLIQRHKYTNTHTRANICTLYAHFESLTAAFMWSMTFLISYMLHKYMPRTQSHYARYSQNHQPSSRFNTHFSVNVYTTKCIISAVFLSLCHSNGGQ